MHRPSRGAPRALVGLLLAGTMLAACGTPSASSAALPPSAILRADPAARTVHLLLEASENDAYGGFNFDGYGDGGMAVRVPVGWQVDVTCTNASTTFTHSCAVIADAPVTTTASHVVFGASTPHPRTGLAFHQTARFGFVANRVGRYRIVCLVTAHEVDGMWDWLVVTPGGRPSVRT